MKKAIGLIIKEIIDEKRLKIAPLAERLGISRQSVYQTYARVEMSDGELSRWAAAMGVDREEITARHSGAVNSTQIDTANFGEEVLMHIRKLLEEELREKNEQIRALQKALEQAQDFSSRLLGKSPEHPDGRVLSNVFTRVDLREDDAAVAG